MINRNVLILTGVLVVGAAAALLVGKGDKPRDARLGQPVLAAAGAAAVDKIAIKKAGAGVTLVKAADGVWHLENDQGFPVDVGRVVHLLDDLGRTSFERVAGEGDKDLADLGMSAAATVGLTAGGKDVLTLKLGDKRKKGGQFVAVGDETKAYLVSQNVGASPDADQWEMKTLVNIDKEQVKEVAFTPAAASGKKPTTLSRAKKEEALKADQILSTVTFVKRYDPGNEEAKAALSAPSQAVVTLFDGRKYTALVGSIGDKTKKYFLKIKGEKGSTQLSDKDQKSLDAMNTLFDHYAFEVPAYVAQRFEPSPQA